LKPASKMTDQPRKILWTFSVGLFAACWLLPILDDNVGYDGAYLAHRTAWKLITQGHELSGVGDLFEIVFIAIGWLANEFYVIGLALVLFSRRGAVRYFAFAVGIMVSWQLGFINEFPLLIGYWVWVAAGGIALWLSASTEVTEKMTSTVKVLTDPPTTALLLFPILISIAALATGGIK
jgi:hypothetical protein